MNNVDLNKFKFYKPTKFSQVDIDNLEKLEIDEWADDEYDILNLKNIFLLKGLAPLEDLFDSNDVVRKPRMETFRFDIEECNIGTKLKHNMIKLSKALP